MPRRRADGTAPSWSSLCEFATAQDGLFTLAQAKEAGYSPQLLQHYIKQDRVERERRGIYRLAHYPRGEHDDLVADWLWTRNEGVVSHDTALALHGLSDILPTRRHLSVPASWRRRPRKAPRGIELHYGLPPEADRAWYGCLPITKPLRTYLDCCDAHLTPDLLEQARREALDRGLFSEAELEASEEARAEEGSSP